MLDTAFGALKDFFSRGFIVGVFLPAFMAINVNVALFSLYFDVSALQQRLTGVLGISAFATAVGVIVLVATVLAVLVSPLLGAVRRILEGDLPLEDVRTYWMHWHQAEFQRIERAAFDAAHYVDALKGRSENTFKEVVAANEEGVKLQAVTKPAVIDVAQKSAEALSAALVRAHNTDVGRANWNPKLGDAVLQTLQQAGADLGEALRQNCSRLENGASDDLAASKKLHRLYQDFLVAIRAAPDAAERIYDRLRFATSSEMVKANIRPTRFGNLRAVMLDYPSRAYGVTFDFLWPRLQLVIKANDNIAPTLEHSRSQLDFCLALWLLTFVSFLAWVITLTLHEQGNPTALLLVWLGWPLSLYGLYQVAVESQKGHTEAVIATIDGYHLELLNALGVKRPANHKEEQEQWKRLQRTVEGHPNGEVVYRADAGPTA